MPRLYKFRKILIGCFLGVFFTFYLQQWLYLDGPPYHIAVHPYFNVAVDDILPDPFSDQTCRFARVHPFHPSTWKYFPTTKPIRCKSRQPELIYLDNDGYLRFNSSEIINSGLGPPENPTVVCSFRPVLRPKGDDMGFYYGTEKYITVAGVKVYDDFLLVSCRAPNFLGLLSSEVYSAFHIHARQLSPDNPSIHFYKPSPNQSLNPFSNPAYKSSKNAFERNNPRDKVPFNPWFNPAGSSRNNRKEMPIVNTSSKPMNIVIVGVDSMSRLAFMRFLPATYRYLTEIMGAVVFSGMNKVADNTFPNLGAILTGEAVYGGRLLNPPDIPFYDEWPLIWKNYSQAGYVTHFAEDLPDFNIFSYLSTGFENPPTDYYLRPFWLAVQQSSVLRYSGHLCLGSKQRNVYQLDYLISFLRRFKEQPHFAFSFLAEFSHDYLNRASAADQGFIDTLEVIRQKHLLNNTLFVFLSDHGHRFDPFRKTPLGRLEERTPFFSMVLPPSLAAHKPTLKRNSVRLTSPYDLHATLVDIINHVTHGRTLGTTVTRYGRSLFAEIPLNRTCEDCGIPEFFCACGLDISEMKLEDREEVQMAREAGKSVVKSINDLLHKTNITDKCSKLIFKDVKRAQMIQSRQLISGQEELTVQVEVEPSGALFEANVRRRNGTFEVRSEIGRINKYKGQSDCITNAIMRKYCYCF